MMHPPLLKAGTDRDTTSTQPLRPVPTVDCPHLPYRRFGNSARGFPLSAIRYSLTQHRVLPASPIPPFLLHFISFLPISHSLLFPQVDRELGKSLIRRHGHKSRQPVSLANPTLAPISSYTHHIHLAIHLPDTLNPARKIEIQLLVVVLSREKIK